MENKVDNALRYRRVKQSIDELGLTNTAAAHLAGISVNTLKAVLNRTGSESSLHSLEAALNDEKEKRSTRLAAKAQLEAIPTKFNDQVDLAKTLASTLSRLTNQMLESAPPVKSPLNEEDRILISRSLRSALKTLEELAK